MARSTAGEKPAKRSEPRRPRTISAGIIPVYFTPDHPEPQVLLLRCYNYWDFPKGGVDHGETSLQAALRELKEETTLDQVDFVWGQEYADTPVYAQGKVARYFVGRVHRLDVSLPVNPLLGRPEHQEFRWVTVSEARSLLGERVKLILDWALEQMSLKPSLQPEPVNHL